MAQWRKLLTSLQQDTDPRLGGNLAVDGNKIISVSNGDIWLDPDGTGTVRLGTLGIKADQTLGVALDDYVLTYDHTGGVISLEKAPTGPANMVSNFSAPTNDGEFQDGARLIVDAYGTSPSATAGNLVNLGATNVSNVGAQSAAAGATGMLLMVTDAGTGDELLIEGVVKLSTTTTTALLPTTAKKGAPVYMSTTVGAVTTTAPSTAGDFVRVVGYVVDAANRTIYFKPDNTWLEL